MQIVRRDSAHSCNFELGLMKRYAGRNLAELVYVQQGAVLLCPFLLRLEGDNPVGQPDNLFGKEHFNNHGDDCKERMCIRNLAPDIVWRQSPDEIQKHREYVNQRNQNARADHIENQVQYSGTLSVAVCGQTGQEVWRYGTDCSADDKVNRRIIA